MLLQSFFFFQSLHLFLLKQFEFFFLSCICHTETVCVSALQQSESAGPIHIYPLFSGFPFHLGHHRALNRVPCPIQEALITYLSYTQQCIYVNLDVPIHLTPPSSHHGIHPFHPVLYVCGSISALQVTSSIRVGHD